MLSFDFGKIFVQEKLLSNKTAVIDFEFENGASIEWTQLICKPNSAITFTVNSGRQPITMDSFLENTPFTFNTWHFGYLMALKLSVTSRIHCQGPIC